MAHAFARFLIVYFWNLFLASTFSHRGFHKLPHRISEMYWSFQEWIWAMYEVISKSFCTFADGPFHQVNTKSSERVSHAGSWGWHWLRGPVCIKPGFLSHSNMFWLLQMMNKLTGRASKRNSVMPSHFKTRAYFFHIRKPNCFTFVSEIGLQFWK